MAKPRGPDAGDGAGDPNGTAPSGRNRTERGDAKSVAEAQDTTAQDAHAGRSSGNRGSPVPVPGSSRTEDLITQPTGHPGGTPDGVPTRIRPDEDEEVRRSLTRENSGAVILADRGHRIQQNPAPDEVARARRATGDSGRPGSKPDYLLDGRVFDCYSPSRNKGVRGIWGEVETKIKREQTQRVVVNLEDWGGSLPDLRRQFTNWPMEHLKELKVITPDGDIVQVTPDPQDD